MFFFYQYLDKIYIGELCSGTLTNYFSHANLSFKYLTFLFMFFIKIDPYSFLKIEC